MKNNMKKSTTEEFIIKAKEVHKNLYDYSITEYIKNDSKVNFYKKQVTI